MENKWIQEHQYVYIHYNGNPFRALYLCVCNTFHLYIIISRRNAACMVSIADKGVRLVLLSESGKWNELCRPVKNVPTLPVEQNSKHIKCYIYSSQPIF